MLRRVFRTSELASELDSFDVVIFIRSIAMSHSLDLSDGVPAKQLGTHADPPSSSAFPDPNERHDGTRLGRMLWAGISWLPSLLVFAVLLTIGWYGHKHDWKLPKRATAVSTTDVAWCDSHGVPEDECIVCRPDLIEDSPKLSFCQQHGVHGCVLCKASLAETKTPTEPTPSDLHRADRALALRPRTENLAIASTPGSRIQFASIAAMKKAGVDVEPVERRHVVESIAAAAEIRYDATKTAGVSPQADGIVRQVFVEVGAWVKQGQALALIDCAEAGRLKTELLAALADERLQQAIVKRLRPIAGQAVAGKRLLESENDLQQAGAIVDRAAAALGNLGIRVDLTQLRKSDGNQADSYVRGLGLRGVSTDVLSLNENNRNLVAVPAPLGGQIVQRAATIGQVVDRGSELLLIVDTRTVWLDLRVSAEEAALVKLGQTVHFWPDGQRQQHSGNVTWISSDVDPQTRTVRVRAELANADQNLRHESFGRGVVVLRDEPDAIVVPEPALQWDGAGQIVFVRDAQFFQEGRPKFFVSRSVRAGVKQDGFIEIIAGVLPGEVVASSGSDVLRAQLLRSKLGAGCTCGH